MYYVSIRLMRFACFGLLAFGIMLRARAKKKGWSPRALLGDTLYKLCPHIVGLAFSVCAGPAVAQQIVDKIKNKQSAAIEQPVDSNDTQPLAAPPPNLEREVSLHGDLRLDIFSDTLGPQFGRHDRQQFGVLNIRANHLFDLASIIQSRETTDNNSLFSYAGAGVRVRLFQSKLAITTVTGPQYTYNKGRVDQQVTFANMSLKTRPLSVLLINRISRGLNPKTADSHRHIIQARAGPLPKWLVLTVEFRHLDHATRAGCFASLLQKCNENFWGATVFFGELLAKHRIFFLFKGLYAYPYFDFVTRKSDIRLGFAHSWTF